jgi:mutator protein MutT
MSADDASAPRVEIAIAVVRDAAGRLLIGQRPAGAALAGLWEFPGGKLLAGETPEAAAVRECLEETGLAVRVVDRYATILHDYPHGRLRLHFFLCAPLGAECRLPARFRWVAAAELGQYTFPDANAPVTERLLADA